MLTDRGKLLALAAVSLWILGRTFAIAEVQMAAVAAGLLVALAFVYTRIASARLATRRTVHPERLFHDAEGTVDLEVRNEGRVPTAVLLVQDKAPAAVAETTRFVLEPVRPGRTRRVTYGTHGRLRGRYTIGPALVHLRDPFGIAQRAVRFGATDDLVVYPPVWALPPTLPRVGRHGTAAEGVARPLAPSGEFANVREYVRGDDLRKVHWKSTARRGKLMVKQEEAPQEAQATLVIDLRRAAHRGVGETSTLEAAIAVASSAAYHLSEHRYALKLITGPFVTPPDTMRWELVLEQLATIQAQHGTTLLPIWRQLAKGGGGDGMLVTVTPIPDAQELREMVRAGRGFDGRVAVLVGVATRRAGDEGQRELAALRASGWRATLYRPGQPLGEAWRELAVRGDGAAARAVVGASS